MFGLKGQKPRQWGPLSAVQWAVRHNCDQLGLRVPLFLSAFDGIDIPMGVQGTVVAPATYGTFDIPSTFSFNGTNDGSINWGNYPHLNITNNLTIFSHAKALGWGEYAAGAIFGRTNTTSSGFYYGYSNRAGTEGTAYFIAQGTGRPVVYTNTGAIALNKWNTVSVSRGGASWEFLVDGIYSGGASNDTAVLYLSYGSNACIGTNNTGSREFHGYISEVIAWNTAENITALHDNPYALIAPAPRPVWFDLGAAPSGSLLPFLRRHYGG